MSVVCFTTTPPQCKATLIPIIIIFIIKAIPSLLLLLHLQLPVSCHLRPPGESPPAPHPGGSAPQLDEGGEGVLVWDSWATGRACVDTLGLTFGSAGEGGPGAGAVRGASEADGEELRAHQRRPPCPGGGRPRPGQEPDAPGEPGPSGQLHHDAPGIMVQLNLFY